MTSDPWLAAFLDRHGAVAGTVHTRVGDLLHITAAVRIPPPVIEATRTIPLGKGMAGLAWQRDTPIQTCNLKEDTTGNVKPGARAVDAKAAVALPVHDAGGGVRAVVGLAWMDERVLDDALVATIQADAEGLPAAE